MTTRSPAEQAVCEAQGRSVADFCYFEAVCGPFREARANRKAADPRLAAFKRLREIP